MVCLQRRRRVRRRLRPRARTLSVPAKVVGDDSPNVPTADKAMGPGWFSCGGSYVPRHPGRHPPTMQGDVTSATGPDHVEHLCVVGMVGVGLALSSTDLAGRRGDKQSVPNRIAHSLACAGLLLKRARDDKSLKDKSTTQPFPANPFVFVEASDSCPIPPHPRRICGATPRTATPSVRVSIRGSVPVFCYRFVSHRRVSSG